jgi:AcrR family transcriptional regulator
VALGRGRPPRARRLREAKDALYREHVIGVAEQAFADRGFAAAHMSAIAAGAGVSLAKLYQLYPGKQQLYRGVLLARDREMVGEVERRLNARPLGPESVEHVLVLMETHLRYLLEHPAYLRMQLREGYAWTARAAHPTGEEHRMWQRGIDSIAQVHAWGVRQGWFSPDEPRELARLLLTAQQTRLANWVAAGMREAHDAVIARIQADFVRLCCRPGVVATLLSEDGASLRAETVARLARVRDGG